MTVHCTGEVLSYTESKCIIVNKSALDTGYGLSNLLYEEETLPTTCSIEPPSHARMQPYLGSPHLHWQKGRRQEVLCVGDSEFLVICPHAVHLQAPVAVVGVSLQLATVEATDFFYICSVNSALALAKPPRAWY